MKVQPGKHTHAVHRCTHTLQDALKAGLEFTLGGASRNKRIRGVAFRLRFPIHKLTFHTAYH